MSRRSSVIYPAIATCLIVSCHKDTQQSSQQGAMVNALSADTGYSEFVDRLMQIESEVTDLTSSRDLLKNEHFTTMYASPATHLEYVKSAIVDDRLSTTQKLIAIFAVQSLSLVDYVELCEHATGLCEDEILPQEVFRAIIMPGYDWNTQLAENYNDWHVARLLQRLLSVGAVRTDDALNEYVRDLRYGVAHAHVRELRDANQIPK